MPEKRNEAYSVFTVYQDVAVETPPFTYPRLENVGTTTTDNGPTSNVQITYFRNSDEWLPAGTTHSPRNVTGGGR